MKIGSSSKRGLDISGSSREKTKKKRKRYKKRKSKKEMARSMVQNLYETCRDVFANGGDGYVPPPSDIDRLKSFLDGMRLEDVNLAPNMPFFGGTNNGEEAHRVTYIHIYGCNKFSIGIFCFPPSAVIPLHDHPNMTVFSKLLFGTLRVKSYDWVDGAAAATSNNDNADQIRNQQQQRIRLAKVHADSDFIAPCETSVLFPAAGGNMHCFRALTPCAILDVLGPPYSESRECRYYKDFPFSRFQGTTELPPGEDKNQYAWLEEIEKPENFVVV